MHQVRWKVTFHFSEGSPDSYLVTEFRGTFDQLMSHIGSNFAGPVGFPGRVIANKLLTHVDYEEI